MVAAQDARILIMAAACMAAADACHLERRQLLIMEPTVSDWQAESPDRLLEPGPDLRTFLPAGDV